MIKDIKIYWNFHKKLYSIVDKKTGRVVEYSSGPIYLKDVVFRVRPAGHAKVLKEKRKNVHSFVCGTRIKTEPNLKWKQEIKYNPYQADYWYDVESFQKITSAAFVKLEVKDQRAIVRVVRGRNA